MKRLSMLLGLTLVLTLAACGGGESDKGEESEGEASELAADACTGSALTDAVKLPSGFPKPDAVTYVKQSEAGPSTVVDGRYDGSLDDAYDNYQSAVDAAGYDVLFDEKEDHDAEISYKTDGFTGQIALREECGDSDKIYVHITNRPE
jgi:hypothetical protein